MIKVKWERSGNHGNCRSGMTATYTTSSGDHETLLAPSAVAAAAANRRRLSPAPVGPSASRQNVLNYRRVASSRSAGTGNITSALHGGAPMAPAHSSAASASGLHGKRNPLAAGGMDTIHESSISSSTDDGSIDEVDQLHIGHHVWTHPLFHLNDRGEVCHRDTNARIAKDEMRDHGEEILKGLIEHVHMRMLEELAFVEQCIPALEDDSLEDHSIAGSSYSSGSVRSSSSSICSTADGFRTMMDTDVPRCIFHTSENYSVAEKLLVFVCSSRGLSCGIWSRSLLLQEGVQIGSMLPYFRAAQQAGFGILVMNPNMNTQTMMCADGEERKLPIEGSSTQEEHCDHVWKNYIFPSAAHKIHFIAYGYGGLLVTNLIEKYKYDLKNRLGNVAFIESSHKADPQWSPGFKRFFSQHSICWKRASEPLNTEIDGCEASRLLFSSRNPQDDESSSASSPSSTATASSSSPSSASAATQPNFAVSQSTFGCVCLSAGMEVTTSSSPAYTTKSVLETVFKFLKAPSAYEFHRLIAREMLVHALRDQGLDPVDEARKTLKTPPEIATDALRASSRRHRSPSRAKQPAPVVTSPARLSSRPPPSPASAEPAEKEKDKDKMTVDDFQLLRVVGRGAFGKVMLVRKKKARRPLFSSPGEGAAGDGAAGADGNKVYAMKVIKKSAVFAKNQVEHTKTERRILEGVDHPFAVKLRYAFQNESKLFFVMDYYNGGTLHFHLRSARRFDEPRARFYAAQIVLALSHLHTYNILYRDLKPENILMDDQGFIALTDFGLSSDHFDPKAEGLKTFCGTPEYIAPELIRRVPYGKSVDYWSLGIMLFEMLAGHTPFYHTNRKRNFENIVRMPLRFPTEPVLSDDAKSIVRGLLSKDPAKRLGSGPGGAREIMEHPFFATVDWERLYKRDVPVPFRPVVRRDGDLNNIPDFFKRQDVMDSAPDAPVPIAKRNEFQDFTYVDPYQLGG
ncbi:hypothetical protein P43SY_006651 [Pythium insidiosum]|uniref:AGC protein kinase n=1 Tax=Pythium insidiosum TaxID=114742 RepID=A0AAD5Q9D1_PYTIN|nr:hypothetical protein P43SY_006651 [Pythium insidiosum]